jgi:hypothetical protein
MKALGLQGTVCYSHHEMLPSQLLRITQWTANGLLAIHICVANKFQKVRRQLITPALIINTVIKNLPKSSLMYHQVLK